jgi:SNF2 family DNA or RNA helicase
LARSATYPRETTVTVRIEISEGRIAAQIPYAGGRGRDAAKRIPGHRPKIINDKFAYWTYPLTMNTCRAFRKEFGPALVIGPQLTEWAWSQRRTEEELEKLRAGSDADLPRVREEAPRLWEALQARPFQIAGAAFIVKANGAILGDEMRLGKTYQALASIVERGANTILIASPVSATYSVWDAKIKELIGIEPYVAQGDRQERDRTIAAFKKAKGRKILIINLQMLRVVRKFACPDGTEWRVAPGRKYGCKAMHEHHHTFYPEFPELFDIDWDMTILDESHHALASQYNKQSDNITQIRLGAVRLPLADGGLRLAMSGTPFRSKTTKAWGSLNWIRPDIFSSFWRFAGEHFDVKNDEWGRKVIGGLLDPTGEALQATLRPYYLARTKADVAPHLPPVVYAGSPPPDDPDGPVGVYLPMDEKQAKAYRSIQEDAAARVENGVIRVNGVLAELTRLRQFASAYGKLSQGKFVPALPSNKYEWVAEYVQEMFDSSDTTKVVIASQFTELVKLFASELRKKHEVLTLTGETTAKQRLHVQDQFLNGSPRIIVINLFAGGEAIDLSSADDLILLDEPWTDDPRQQVENRIQNLAKRQQVTIHRLRSSGTIEETVAAMTDEQRELLMSARPKALALAKDVLGDGS